MITVLSPAKNLDYDQIDNQLATQPLFTKEPEKLIKKLRKLKPADISDLMHLSPKLSDLNYERYKSFEFEEGKGELKQAALAFNGEVYNGLKAELYTEDELEYAQKHLRILSGLYGILKPMDLIQPYRLEMGTRFEIDANTKNLYQFWTKKVTKEINSILKETESTVLFNLASQEYFKAVDVKSVKAPIVSAVFKEAKGDTYKPIMVFAKKARGMMASFILKNKIRTVEEAKSFDEEGYIYRSEFSTDLELVFTRG